MNAATALHRLVERRAVPRSPAPTASARRERDFGVGYGNSSGYASHRRYSNSGFQPLFRCA